MYNLLRLDSEGCFDASATASVLRERYPTADVVALDHLLSVTNQVVRLIDSPPEGKRPAQHLWLFDLAGRIKGALSEELRADQEVGVRLAPLSLVFVDGLEIAHLLPPARRRIHWEDGDAVMLEFEEIWYKRRFAKGSPFLDDAVASAFQNRLKLTGNPHFIRLLNVAHYLQSQQPGLPILLPVSPILASKLNTTPVTLGTAVARAIREGYLDIVDGTYNIKAGKARSFRVNLDHPGFRRPSENILPKA